MVLTGLVYDWLNSDGFSNEGADMKSFKLPENVLDEILGIIVISCMGIALGVMMGLGI